MRIFFFCFFFCISVHKDELHYVFFLGGILFCFFDSATPFIKSCKKKKKKKKKKTHYSYQNSAKSPTQNPSTLNTQPPNEVSMVLYVAFTEYESPRGCTEGGDTSSPLFPKVPCRQKEDVIC